MCSPLFCCGPGAGPPSTGTLGAGPPSTGPLGAGPPSVGLPSTGPLGAGPPSTGPPSVCPLTTGPLSVGPPSTGPPGTGPSVFVLPVLVLLVLFLPVLVLLVLVPSSAGPSHTCNMTTMSTGRVHMRSGLLLEACHQHECAATLISHSEHQGSHDAPGRVRKPWVDAAALC